MRPILSSRSVASASPSHARSHGPSLLGATRVDAAAIALLCAAALVLCGSDQAGAAPPSAAGAPGAAATSAATTTGAAATSAAATSAPASSATALRAILEVDREAYYAGDPVPIRISVWNDGGAAIDAPGGTLESGFELYDVDGKKVSAAAGPAGDTAEAEVVKAEGGRGARALGPGAFYGFARDLTSLFPRLKRAGTYRLQWKAGGLVSNPVILKVVPKYDPEKDYVARVETDLGAFTVEFFRKDAPLAVKAFVELASEGFFNGVIFHYVEPGRIVSSGDPTGTGRGGPGFTIPAERSEMKILAGTLIMRPLGQPPSNGSIFEILLTPRSDYEGVMTPFGQVVSGLEVVGTISAVPAMARGTQTPHRPLKDVRITKVTISPKGA